MTATNHVVTGALIAVYVNQPALAIPLAFAAHFAMDAIPHFRITAENDLDRFNKRGFRDFLIADLALAALLLVLLPLLLSQTAAWWLVLACMIACASPDLIWGWRFFQALYKKVERAKNVFSRFHTVIQWSETQNGIFVELSWFFAVSLLVIFKSVE